jgi:hypothetical protein
LTGCHISILTSICNAIERLQSFGFSGHSGIRS